MKAWVSGKLSIDQALCLAFGVVFLIVMLIFAVIFPDLTPARARTFHITMSLVAGALGAVIPGLFEINGRIANLAIRATGALALFVMVFLLSPTQF